MIRVLEVLATLKRAGAEHVAVALARGLAPERFATGVVSLYDPFPGGLQDELGSRGVPVWYLGKRPGFDPRMWPRLRNVVRRFKPDVLHTHSYVLRYSWPASGGARVVHTVHNLADREVDLAGRLIHRVAYRRGVVPVAVSEAVAASVARRYGIRPETIRNGIDVHRFSSAAGGWREANGFSPDHVLVVSAARLEPQKNPLGLVRAFAECSPRAHLLLAGDGSLRDAVRGERVHVLGVRQDLPELLAAADIFALASDWEGHPLAVMEAMAAGLPVVATAVGGVPEIVGDAGVLVRDAEAMREPLTKLVEDQELRTRLGAKARDRARLFSVERMVEEYEQLFERLVRA